MRFQGLDLNLLVVLDMIVEHRSVSLASEALNLSQSATSAALGRLREFFEDELLKPGGRGMVLTPKAEELAPVVRAALLNIKSTITNPASFDPATSKREFTISASDYVETVLLDPFLRRIAREAPNLRFHFIPVSEYSLEEFGRGTIDLIILADSLRLPDHPKVELFEDRAQLICSNSHPTIGNAITLEQFSAAGHVTASLNNRGFGSLFDQMLQNLAIERRVEVQVPAFCMMAGAVVGTDRLAIMQGRLAEHFAKSLPVKIVSLPFAMPTIREIAQWHAQREHDSGIRWLADALVEEAKRLSSSVNLEEGERVPV